MNKLFSKVAALSVGLAMAIGVGVAVGSKEAKVAKADSTVTFTVGTDSGNTSLSKDGVSVTTTSGTFSRTDNYRVYANNSMTVSCSSGNITAMSFTISQNTFTADVGTWSNSSWTGSAQSITLSASGGQVRFTTFSVTVSGGGPVVSYTITYDANGGSGSMENSTNTVSECTFTAPEGKRFKEWNVAADGSGESYAKGDSAASDLDLFAIWEDKPLAVSLDKIGSTLGSEYSSSISTVDILDGSDTYTLNYVNGKKQSDAMILLKSSGAFISNKTVMPGDITSVEVFINSGASGSATYDIAFGVSEYTTATSGIGAVNITGGSSHEFVNSSVSGAKYFCLTLGAAYNGQVLKIVVNYESSVDPSKKNMTIYQGENPADGGTFLWSGSAGIYTFTAKEESANVSGVSWSVSDTTVATINASTGALTCVKPGNVTVYAEAEGYNKASAAIEISKSWLEDLTLSGSMSKTSYYVGEDWSHEGLTVTATYHSGWEEEVSSTASWNYSPAAPALGVTSVIATATIGEVSGNSAAQSVTVTRANPLKALYSKNNGDNITAVGYYVGFSAADGAYIMDGEYGFLLGDKNLDPSEWVEGETVLRGTGTLYKTSSNQYKFSYTNLSVEVVTDEAVIAEISEPVVYSSTGNETTPDYQNRVTTVSGTVASVDQGSLTADPGTSDIKMTFTVGTNNVVVFYKKGVQDSTTMEKLKAAYDSNPKTEITVKGFTSWYNGFQVQMNGIVEEKEDYTAEDFAQDLIDQTDAVCVNYVDGESSYSEFKAELTTIWNNLASKDKYPSLPGAQKTILAEAARDEEGTVVEQAMARYDFLTGKYELSNFINGRTPIVPANGRYGDISSITSDNTMIIVITIASVSALAFTTLLVFKKKKQK